VWCSLIREAESNARHEQLRAENAALRKEFKELMDLQLTTTKGLCCLHAAFVFAFSFLLSLSHL
jgi:hypothetical protein